MEERYKGWRDDLVGKRRVVFEDLSLIFCVYIEGGLEF